MLKYGWYDSPILVHGNLILSYWNHVVNQFPSIGIDQNDVRRYTKEHYVDACREYINSHTYIHPNRKFIIDLPLAEVYSDGERIAEDGYTEVIPIWKTTEWLNYVIQELDSDPRVIGWYHADEPEVWGYREVVNGNIVNTSPAITYSFLKERYDSIKQVSKKPVFAVFCDTSLFKARYLEHIKSKGKFFDVFGFDYYPFTPTNDKVDERKIKDFISIAGSIDRSMPIMFVGQGSGGQVFNNRPPTLKEHETLFKAFIKHCPVEKRFAYLLWSGSTTYVTSKALNTGNTALTKLSKWSQEQDKECKDVGFFKRVLIFLRNILHL
jgi:hypothetical protein